MSKKLNTEGFRNSRDIVIPSTASSFRPHSIPENHSNQSSHQCLTSFPDENHKHIDYVIVYQEFNEQELKDSKKKSLIKKNQDLFFQKLQKETFEIYDVPFKNEKGQSFVYSLLHCPTDRLLEQIEDLSFEMKLKNCKIDDLDQTKNDTFSIKQGLNKLREELDKENFKSQIKNGNVVSAEFDPSIKYMYEGLNDLKNYPMGPFSNNIRHIVVESILNNVTFTNTQEILKMKSKQKVKELILRNKNNYTNEYVEELMDPMVEQASKTEKNQKEIGAKGLIYMIEKKYFEDAFVLHEETQKDVDFINELIEYINSKNLEQKIENKLDPLVVTNQTRQYLRKKWANLAKTLFFQPIWEIRDYFGEMNAFYYSWLGVMISTLWLLAAIGISSFVYGLYIGIGSAKTINSTDPTTVGNYYLDIFLYSFDNDYMPYFSTALCLWGFIFTEYWTRKENRLAFEWDTENFDNTETDLPEFFRKKIARKDAWSCTKWFYLREKKIKKFFSYIILLIMCGAACLAIAAAVIYRVWIKIKVYPNDVTAKTILGDVGSIFLNSFFIAVLNQVYRRIAKYTTSWENPRTKTEFQNNLNMKLFIFNFVNNYGSLFYLSYFRGNHFSYEKGYFDLGKEYTDSCGNACTTLLTFQILIQHVVKPLPSIFLNFVLPWFKYKQNLKAIRKQIENLYENKNEDITPEIQNTKKSDPQPHSKIDESQKITQKNLNEKLVEIYLTIERQKSDASELIDDEFHDKTTLYGYMIIFGCVFSLSPLFVIVIFLLTLRLLSKSLLMYHRRVVGYRTQNVGIWIWICRFLNAVAIANLSFYTALNSTWAKSKGSIIADNYTNRYIFIIVFENSAFIVWLIVLFLIPAKSQKILLKIRQENDYKKLILTTAKNIENKIDHEDRLNIASDQSSDQIDSDSDENQSVREFTNPSIFSRSKDKVHPRKHDETNV